jgi:hypothetical protein
MPSRPHVSGQLRRGGCRPRLDVEAIGVVKERTVMPPAVARLQSAAVAEQFAKSLPPQRYRKLIDGLLNDFEGMTELTYRAADVRTGRLVFALTNQIHRTAAAILVLNDADMDHEAQPLLRQVLEFTVQAHWLSCRGDGVVDLFLGRDERSRKAFLADVGSDGPFTIDADLAEEIRAAEAPVRSDLGELATIEAVFNSLGLRSSLWVVYRYLSGYAHPSSFAVSGYLTELHDGTIAGVKRPEPPGEHAILGILVHCLIWSSRALDDLVLGKPRKQRLREVAKELGVRPRLPIPA